MTTEREKTLIYLAGLFDGEGYCFIESQGKNRPKRWALGINMTHKPTIDLFAKTFNSTVTFSPRRKEHYLDIWRCRANRLKALEIAKQLYPYAFTKKAELLQLIQHYEDGR